MAGMNLLRSPAEWAQYTQRMAQEYNVPPNQVTWGSGPQQYPCMVASTMSSPMKMVSCYVYLSDAQQLVQAAGLRLVSNEQLNQMQQGVPGHSSHDFEKHTAAMLMALIEELSDIGAIKQDRFEATLQKHLATVDQYHEADKDAARKQAGAAGDILARLFPSDDNPGE